MAPIAGNLPVRESFPEAGSGACAERFVTPLAAATSKAAEGIAMSDIGLIEAGRFADMVYVTADPLADVRVLQI
jgi:imidazolonepropionase-like amidohydrolase